MRFKYSVFLVKLLQKLPNFWNNFQSADVVLLNVTQINHILTFQRPSVESKAEEVGFKAKVFAYYQFHEFFAFNYFLYEYFDFSRFFFSGHAAIMFRKYGTKWGQSTKLGCHINKKFANCWFL